MDPVVYSARPTLPNFIYVSELLRTWETAVLLFLNKESNTNLTLYISPYLAEGFGLTMLEALASGLRVLVPRTGSASDYIDPIYIDDTYFE